MIALVLPAVMSAVELPAMLYTHGTALLNGNSVVRSSAIFSGDLVQTARSSAANINASGSIVLILNDSLVQYQGSTVKLERGGVTISTSKLLAIRAGDVTVSPKSNGWTEFEVRDVDGKVEIAARKGDLTVADDTGTVTLPQDQQTTREDPQSQNADKQKKKKAATGPATAASGGILNSPLAIGIGGGAILGATAWVLVQGDQPASPSK